jgi:hypothetical protein
MGRPVKNIRSGPKYKGSVITDSVNVKKRGNLGRRGIAKVKREAEASLTSKIKELGMSMLEDRFDPPKPSPKPSPDQPAEQPASSPAPSPTPSDNELEPDDPGFSSKMWSDLRAAYRSVSGKNKLITMMRDDKNFQMLFKELMKMEAVKLAAEMRSRDQGNQAGFFVILKGLEDDVATIARLKAEREAKKGAIDLAQVSHMLDPEAGKYEAVEEEGDSGIKEIQLEGPATW